ncbi:helix-turn-helix domain-containing protein [Filimonas lacunae]|nr:LuxR C-terminal-related transcriptional regulator [Filimonas lacunae]
MENITTAYRLISRREKEILQLVAQGHTSSTIATQLFLSKRTVENHRVNILKKLAVKNTVSMLSRAREYNLL